MNKQQEILERREVVKRMTLVGVAKWANLAYQTVSKFVQGGEVRVATEVAIVIGTRMEIQRRIREGEQELAQLKADLETVKDWDKELISSGGIPGTKINFQ